MQIEVPSRPAAAQVTSSSSVCVSVQTRKVSGMSIKSTENIRNYAVVSTMNGYSFTGEKLGTGAYSRVERAYSNKLCCFVAVKITDSLLSPCDFVENYAKREVRILRRLNHENIIDIYESFEHDDKLYTVLAIAEEGCLENYVRRKIRLQETEARGMFCQILRGVSYCHNRARIAHGDISCANVLLTANGDLKLADFGMAVDVKKSERIKLHTSDGGTLGYLAPEILDGKPYDPRQADIWSLGVVLFYMVTGSYPFGISDGMVSMRTGMDRTPRWPRPLNRISKECRDLIKIMLTLDTEKRANLRDIWKSDWLKSHNSDR
ncbi:testis-specific serine/threonine-protein kinase 3-like [Glandiceps talaboti]